MNDQQAQGKADQAGGKIKEGIGNLTGDERTKAEGQNQQLEGGIRKGVGDAKDKAGNLGNRLADAKDRAADAMKGNDQDR